MTRLTARYATALVFSLSVVCGALTYAQISTTDTLAGPSKEIEPPTAGCPKDYPNLVPVDGMKERFVVDINRDGFVCRAVGTDEYVDNNGDTGDPNSSPTRHVTGHGNFFDSNPKKEAKVQDISFSFHGIGIDGESGADAKGKFEFHDQTPAGADLTVHGDVLCLTVLDGTATFLGIVTRSNDADLSADTLVVWKAQDNGEGHNAIEADTVTRLSPAGKVIPNTCKFAAVKLVFRGIISGNIQAHEDETAGGVPTKIEEKSIEDVDSDSWGVSGEGKFFDAGKKAGVLQDIAFSFAATGEGENGKVIDGVATGAFEYQDQTPGAIGLAVRGQVVCASVAANEVTLIGVVTMSNDKGVPVETLVAWKAEDNGDDGTMDRVSRLQAIGVKTVKGGLCSGKVPQLKLQSLASGQVLVK